MFLKYDIVNFVRHVNVTPVKTNFQKPPQINNYQLYGDKRSKI